MCLIRTDFIAVLRLKDMLCSTDASAFLLDFL